MLWAVGEHQKVLKPFLGSYVTGLEEMLELGTAVFLQRKRSVLVLRAVVWS